MGQSSSSTENRRLTPEELSAHLASKFAEKCFSGVELYSFKDNFRSLADVSHSDGGFLYWSEDTLIRFLELPTTLDVGPILFQAASNLGAFPSAKLAPAILNFESLIKVVALITGRYKKALKNQPDSNKFMFRAFAVHDRGVPVRNEAILEIDALENDYHSDDSEDLPLDEIVAVNGKILPALIEKPSSMRRLQIPIENMRKLILFLLAIAPLEDNQSLAAYVDRFAPEVLEGLNDTVERVIRGFGLLTDDQGISYAVFKKAIRTSMPFMLSSGLPALFSHFLFSKKLDMSASLGQAYEDIREPLLSRTGTILDLNMLSQISLFVLGERLWRRVRLLYAGSEAGFSLGSLESKVLKWNAPTILLVSGQPIPDKPDSAPARAFCDRLPPQRYPSKIQPERYVFGVFLETPWKISHKDCFGDSNVRLFQLSPVHEVYSASTSAFDYAYFNKEDGVGFGAPVQKWKQSHRNSPYFNLGPVSLVLDQNLEFGVFNHTGDGGSYHLGESVGGSWQVRFEIDEVEVWGCGGASEAEAQRKAWQWEEREALLRRQINLGKDIEADRALLEMAGLIGQNRSGGSMN
ncbi:TLD-domain-containing protein [Geopyxis carbonaria]|nr:TLD-domain-containing protein [Geopyxis carbonaria]